MLVLIVLERARIKRYRAEEFILSEQRELRHYSVVGDRFVRRKSQVQGGIDVHHRFFLFQNVTCRALPELHLASVKKRIVYASGVSDASGVLIAVEQADRDRIVRNEFLDLFSKEH